MHPTHTVSCLKAPEPFIFKAETAFRTERGKPMSGRQSSNHEGHLEGARGRLPSGERSLTSPLDRNSLVHRAVSQI